MRTFFRAILLGFSLLSCAAYVGAFFENLSSPVRVYVWSSHTMEGPPRDFPAFERLQAAKRWDAIYFGAFAVVFSALPTLWIRNWWKRRGPRERVVAGRCLVCGYDLRANTDRCPECGTPMPVEAEEVT